MDAPSDSPAAPRRRGPAKPKDAPPQEYGEEVIRQVAFVASVRWLLSERTSVDVGTAELGAKHATITWHQRGVQLDADGQRPVIVPAANLRWVALA